jgi:hypothetical protein
VSRGVEQIANLFRTAGFSVNVWYYADEFYDRTDEGDTYHPSLGVIRPDHYGFLSLLLDMAATRDRLFDFETGYSPLIILAAHSHGTVWAHSAAMLMPDFPIDFLIDLDGESALWEAEILFAGDDWLNVIENYEERNSVIFPTRDPSWILGYATDYFSIPGLVSQYDIEDVVPNNVWINLEVAADIELADVSFRQIQDGETNYRFDGTRSNIFRYVATGLSHRAVHQAESRSINWVIDQIVAVFGG